MKGGWDAASFIEAAVAEIRAAVGEGSVLCAMSGGVDSAVTALLVHKAIGSRLTSIFVDTGLLRLDEGRKVIEIFKTLQQEGLPAHLFDRVHAPVGLDIGAVTPEEIAVAITAELIAVRRHSPAALPHMSWFHNQRHEIQTQALKDQK